MGFEKIDAGELSVVIGDNSAHQQHRAGYNGIWSLAHAKQPENPFVNEVAGLNLEHIFDGHQNGSREVFFEPRHAPMTIKQLDETTVELHQPPTPTFHLESWTKFRVTPPDAIDFSFRCLAHQHVFTHGYIGLFWASYMNAPDDRSMYFLGGVDGESAKSWQQHCTPKHNNQSTVCKRGHRKPLTFSDHFRDCLHKNLSPLVYDVPMFHGHVRNMTLVYLFDSDERLRLTHSPSGGGFNSQRQTNNPAWDFQFVVPAYDVNKEYGFSGRLIYRPTMSREQIVATYEEWKKSRGTAK